ncbi:MAG: four helix bundle protein [Candidatus Moranbacteria bacterium]|nr:four helix bundle protein [Candidatus Moranbacteria bacterium]MDZ7611145.1 four helix bundle protein [Candidatus Moranbacteria bacterium]MDZ7611427.1 four helix bundle protein [Candidatus Moranbacteria bacterium]
MKYDLEQRTVQFSEKVIDLVKSVKINSVNKSIVNQLTRSATSVGANYCEANGASSKKDFKNKIYICKKESKETMYWLRLLAKTNPEKIEEIRILWKEIQEFTMIFSKIISTIKNGKKKE